MNLSSLLFVGLFLALLANSALALKASVPGSFVVSQAQSTLEIMVQNDSAIEQPLQIIFFVPSHFQVAAPAKIASNGIATIQITLENQSFLYHSTYETNLIIRLGNQSFLRKITVSFQDPNKQPASNQAESNGFAQNVGRNLVLGFLFLSNAINAELAVQIVLAIIIVVLLIALLARVHNRIQGEKA